MSVNDKGIVDTLKECPENGFRMLMMKYQEPVYWHIRRLVVSHDDAQDASQETFVRIYRSFNQYRGDCGSSANGNRKKFLWNQIQRASVSSQPIIISTSMIRWR